MKKKLSVSFSLAQYTGVLNNMVGGFEVISTFNAYHRMAKEFEKENQSVETIKQKLTLYMAMTEMISIGMTMSMFLTSFIRKKVMKEHRGIYRNAAFKYVHTRKNMYLALTVEFCNTCRIFPGRI